MFMPPNIKINLGKPALSNGVNLKEELPFLYSPMNKMPNINIGGFISGFNTMPTPMIDLSKINLNHDFQL